MQADPCYAVNAGALPVPCAAGPRVVHLGIDLDPYEAFEKAGQLFERAVVAWNRGGTALVPHYGHFLPPPEAIRLAQRLEAAAFEAMAQESFSLAPTAKE